MDRQAGALFFIGLPEVMYRGRKRGPAYEDEHLIVVNKPAKLLSVATDKEKARTAYHMVTDYVKARRVGDRIFVLHRLDRDTSGVLMFARDPETKEPSPCRWPR